MSFISDWSFVINIFRKGKIKPFTLTPLFSMHKEGDTMSEVVAVGSWCATATTSPRFELSSLLVEKSLSKTLLTHLLWIFYSSRRSSP